MDDLYNSHKPCGLSSVFLSTHGANSPLLPKASLGGARWALPFLWGPAQAPAVPRRLGRPLLRGSGEVMTSEALPDRLSAPCLRGSRAARPTHRPAAPGSTARARAPRRCRPRQGAAARPAAGPAPRLSALGVAGGPAVRRGRRSGRRSLGRCPGGAGPAGLQPW